MKKLCLTALCLAGALVSNSVAAKEYFNEQNKLVYSDEGGCFLMSMGEVDEGPITARLGAYADGSHRLVFLTPFAPELERGETRDETVTLLFLGANDDFVGEERSLSAAAFAPTGNDRYFWSIDLDANLAAAIRNDMSQAITFGIFLDEELMGAGNMTEGGAMVRAFETCLAEEGWRNP